MLADLRMDLVHAARTALRAPGFLVCATLTLALGIGANTAIFSLIDAVMLDPLHVPEPSRLVQIVQTDAKGGIGPVSYPLFQYLHGRLASVSGAFAEMEIVNTITLDGVDEDLYGDAVSGDYYHVLGLAPAAGRLIGPGDDAAAAPVAVISYAYWRRRFGLSPGAIGKSFRIGATELTIVGVEPAGFEGTSHENTHDFTTPLLTAGRITPSSGAWKQQPQIAFLAMMARLKSGVTVAQANAEIDAVFDAWRRENHLRNQGAEALPAAAGLTGFQRRFRAPLTILMTIVALVLLLACANLSGLLLARGASRQREISLRRALGAGSGRLLRQFLAESLLLAGLGAAVGFAFAQWFTRALILIMANGDQFALRVRPDWRVLAFTAAISIAACVIAGLAPGLTAARGNLNPALKEARGVRHRALGRALVASQLAISMTLLVGASLFIRTLVKLYTSDTGVRTGGVFTFGVTAKHHLAPERVPGIEESIVARLQSLPGVLAASAAGSLPLNGWILDESVHVEGRDGPSSENAALNAIAPRFFAAAGIPLLVGRDFDARDDARSNPVAIVNRAFVRAFFGDQPALGRRVTLHNVAYEIVGVAGDAKYDLRADAPNTVYIPWTQQGNLGDSNRSQPMGFSYLARVAAGDPLSLAAAMERSIPEIDPVLRLRTPQTLIEVADRTTLNERIMATLGGFFGALALVVASLGVFGLLAFQVSRRASEIGVRLALGASRGDVAGLVLREAGTMLPPGCAAGAVAALFLTRFARTVLFGVTPGDPATFALAAGALAIAALAAAFVPALRAARIDPMSALRHE